MTFIGQPFAFFPKVNCNQGSAFGQSGFSNCMPMNQNPAQGAMMGLGLMFAGMDMIDNGQLDGSIMSFLNNGSNNVGSSQPQSYAMAQAGPNGAQAFAGNNQQCNMPQNQNPMMQMMMQMMQMMMQIMMQMFGMVNNFDQAGNQNQNNGFMPVGNSGNNMGWNPIQSANQIMNGGNGASPATGTGQSGSLTNAQPSGATRNPGAGTFGGVKLNQEQVNNARIIAEVGAEMGASKRDISIAIATAMQESTLKNINYGDRDSVGLFQQRPSCGWGSVEQCTNPRYAATQFYNHLLKDGNRNNKSLTKAAQDVQRSAYPNAYAKWENMAVNLTNAIC